MLGQRRNLLQTLTRMISMWFIEGTVVFGSAIISGVKSAGMKGLSCPRAKLTCWAIGCGSNGSHFVSDAAGDERRSGFVASSPHIV